MIFSVIGVEKSNNVVHFASEYQPLNVAPEPLSLKADITVSLIQSPLFTSNHSLLPGYELNSPPFASKVTINVSFHLAVNNVFSFTIVVLFHFVSVESYQPLNMLPSFVGVGNVPYFLPMTFSTLAT